MTTTVQTLTYRPRWGREGRAMLRIFPGYGGRPLCLVTEVDDNTGASITNAIEDVAVALDVLIGTPLHQGGYMLVEHYQGRPGLHSGLGSLDLVGLESDEEGYANPQWSRLSARTFDVLAGGSQASEAVGLDLLSEMAS